jgi:hypothetical protein
MEKYFLRGGGKTTPVPIRGVEQEHGDISKFLHAEFASANAPKLPKWRD